jgi:hypothetical protein
MLARNWLLTSFARWAASRALAGDALVHEAQAQGLGCFPLIAHRVHDRDEGKQEQA